MRRLLCILVLCMLTTVPTTAAANRVCVDKDDGVRLAENCDEIVWRIVEHVCDAIHGCEASPP